MKAAAEARLPPVRDMLKEKSLVHRMSSADLLRRLPDFTFEGPRSTYRNCA